MIYLLMADHSFEQLPEATTAFVENDQVVCRSAGGNIIAMFNVSTVAAYGTNEALRNPKTPIIHFNANDGRAQTICGALLGEVESSPDPNAATCISCKILSKVGTDSPYSESMAFKPS